MGLSGCIYIAEHTFKPCRALFCRNTVQQLQQLRIPVCIRSALSGKAVGVYSRCAVQRIHQQSAVVGDNRTVQCLVYGTCFQRCVFGERLAVFLYLNGNACLLLGDHGKAKGL